MWKRVARIPWPVVALRASFLLAAVVTWKQGMRGAGDLILIEVVLERVAVFYLPKATRQ